MNFKLIFIDCLNGKFWVLVCIILEMHGENLHSNEEGAEKRKQKVENLLIMVLQWEVHIINRIVEWGRNQNDYRKYHVRYVDGHCYRWGAQNLLTIFLKQIFFLTLDMKIMNQKNLFTILSVESLKGEFLT